MRSKRQYVTVDAPLMTPIVWLWNTAAGHIRVCNDDASTSNRDFGFACDFPKFCYTRCALTRGKSCYFDEWNNILRDMLSRILSSFRRVKILPFFLPILCYPRGSMIRFIVPNFSKNRVSR